MKDEGPNNGGRSFVLELDFGHHDWSSDEYQRLTGQWIATLPLNSCFAFIPGCWETRLWLAVTRTLWYYFQAQSCWVKNADLSDRQTKAFASLPLLLVILAMPPMFFCNFGHDPWKISINFSVFIYQTTEPYYRKGTTVTVTLNFTFIFIVKLVLFHLLYSIKFKQEKKITLNQGDVPMNLGFTRNGLARRSELICALNISTCISQTRIFTDIILTATPLVFWIGFYQ